MTTIVCCRQTFMCVILWMCECVCGWVGVCVCGYVHICKCVYIYIYIYIYIYVCALSQRLMIKYYQLTL